MPEYHRLPSFCFNQALIRKRLFKIIENISQSVSNKWYTRISIHIFSSIHSVSEHNILKLWNTVVKFSGSASLWFLVGLKRERYDLRTWGISTEDKTILSRLVQRSNEPIYTYIVRERLKNDKLIFQSQNFFLIIFKKLVQKY